MADWGLHKNGWVLIDSNFLIDFYSKESLYKDFLIEVEEKDVEVVATELKKIEFIRSKDLEVVKKKLNFFTKFIDSCLPLDFETLTLLQPLVEEYHGDIEGVSVIDLTLGCLLKRYKQIPLLTRNHSDFPTKIFNRTHIVNIENNKDVKTYALYQYKPEENEIEIEAVIK